MNVLVLYVLYVYYDCKRQDGGSVCCCHDYRIDARLQNCRCCYFQTPSVVHCMNATASAQSPKFLRNFYPQTIFCQLLRVTRKCSCTSAGNAQAQLHYRDDQQRAFGISDISNCVLHCVSRVIWSIMSYACHTEQEYPQERR